MESNKQNGGGRGNDFLLEKRLRTEAPDLHRRVADCVTVLSVTDNRRAPNAPHWRVTGT